MGRSVFHTLRYPARSNDPRQVDAYRALFVNEACRFEFCSKRGGVKTFLVNVPFPFMVITTPQVPFQRAGVVGAVPNQGTDPGHQALPQPRLERKFLSSR